MCFTVQLSKSISYLAVSQTALIFYHVAFDLSRTFLTFFKSLWKCFFLFLSFYVFLRRNSDIISSVFWIVNNFFKVFWFFYNFQLSRNSWFLAVFRQLSKTALTEYHDTPALSTLIFSFLYIYFFISVHCERIAGHGVNQYHLLKGLLGKLISYDNKFLVFEISIYIVKFSEIYLLKIKKKLWFLHIEVQKDIPNNRIRVTKILVNINAKKPPANASGFSSAFNEGGR